MEEVYEDLKGFTKLFQSELHIIHINQDHHILRNKIFEIKTEKDIQLTFSERSNVSLEEGLFKYTLEKEIDLLVMVKQKKGFLNRLLFGSNTKKMILQTEIPLLIFKED